MGKKNRIEDALKTNPEGLTITEIKDLTSLDFSQINYTLENHPKDFEEIFVDGMPKYKLNSKGEFQNGKK